MFSNTLSQVDIGQLHASLLTDMGSPQSLYQPAQRQLELHYLHSNICCSDELLTSGCTPIC
jgi:hypothetical protein